MRFRSCMRNDGQQDAVRQTSMGLSWKTEFEPWRGVLDTQGWVSPSFPAFSLPVSRINGHLQRTKRRNIEGLGPREGPDHPPRPSTEYACSSTVDTSHVLTQLSRFARRTSCRVRYQEVETRYFNEEPGFLAAGASVGAQVLIFTCPALRTKFPHASPIFINFTIGDPASPQSGVRPVLAWAEHA